MIMKLISCTISKSVLSYSLFTVCSRIRSFIHREQNILCYCCRLLNVFVYLNIFPQNLVVEEKKCCSTPVIHGLENIVIEDLEKRFFVFNVFESFHTSINYETKNQANTNYPIKCDNVRLFENNRLLASSETSCKSANSQVQISRLADLSPPQDRF